MDQISQKDQDKIKKMSDVRLVSSLTKAGVSQDDIEAMDRTTMMDKWARIVAAGGDKTPGAATVTGVTTAGYDVTLERERLAFEKLKWEEQKKESARLAELEKEKIQLERDRLAAQQLERERLIEETAREAEFRDRRLDAEDRQKREELEFQREREKAKVTQLKRFGDAIRNSISKWVRIHHAISYHSSQISNGYVMNYVFRKILKSFC